MERHLDCNGTRIVKIFLHLSKEEQRKRFLARIDEPEKNWKFSWRIFTSGSTGSQYQEAFEECLQATSTRHAPWYAVPADDKENARLIVSQIVLDTLGELKMSYPRDNGEASPGTAGDPQATGEVRAGAGNWAGLLQDLDGCCAQAESFQDGADVGEVAQDGGLLDDGRHDDGVAGIEHQICRSRHRRRARVGPGCLAGG